MEDCKQLQRTRIGTRSGLRLSTPEIPYSVQRRLEQETNSDASDKQWNRQSTIVRTSECSEALCTFPPSPFFFDANNNINTRGAPRFQFSSKPFLNPLLFFQFSSIFIDISYLNSDSSSISLLSLLILTLCSQLQPMQCLCRFTRYRLCCSL